MNAVVNVMETSPALEGIDLVLVRLLVGEKKPPTPAKIRDELSRLLEQAPSTESLQGWVDHLRMDGLLAKRGMRLTEDGRKRALEILGVQELPPRSNWQTIQSRFLLPRALGLNPESEEARHIQTAPALLKHRFKLSVPENASLDQVLVALTCKGLGIPEETSLKEIQAAVLGRMLGKRLPPKQTKQLAPRLLLGAMKGDVKGLREAVLRTWLKGVSSSPGTKIEEQPSSREEAADFDLGAFAHTVLAAARDMPTGRFGDNKVLINHVWRRLASESAFAGMDLAGFKERLIEANRANLLTLSRADLANLLDPQDVAESETHYFNGVFHFILIEKDRP